MKKQTKYILGATALTVALASPASAVGVFIVGVDGAASVSGTTTTVEGNNFNVGGSGLRWDNEGVVNTTDYAGDFNTTSSDHYLQIIGAPLTGFSLLVSDNRYVEIFYSLSANVTAAPASDPDDHRFFLSDTAIGTNQGNNPNDGTLIPTAAGSHSFVLDLLSSDGTTLDSVFTGTATWDQFRIDPWNNTANNAANDGITYTLDKMVFGNAVTIPEPSSAALLGLGALGFMIRRRR